MALVERACKGIGGILTLGRLVWCIALALALATAFRLERRDLEVAGFFLAWDDGRYGEDLLCCVFGVVGVAVY